MEKLALKRLRTVHSNMLSRCGNPNHPTYKWYGGKGIIVCERWRKFKNFFEDVGYPPKDKWIDRWPDNSGNYEPGNIRWATPKQQQNNRRNNITTEEKRRRLKVQKDKKRADMKRKSARNKIRRLVKLCGGNGGGRISVAERLGLSLSYIYRLEKAKEKPGRRLYKDICGLCEELEAKNADI